MPQNADRAALQTWLDRPHPSDDGLLFIQGWEKCRLRRYLDGQGNPTIGWGHLLQANDPRVSLTQEEADALFVLDVLPCAEHVFKLVYMPVRQYQFDAMVALAFNIGETRLAGSTLLKRVNGGYFTEAAAEFEKWDEARNRSTGLLEEVGGLLKRRRAERAIFERADYSGRP